MSATPGSFPDSLCTESLVDDVAAREGWDDRDRVRFDRVLATLLAVERVQDVLVIARSGSEPLLDRVIAVCSWPRFESASVIAGPTPILDATAELALKF